MYRPLTYGFVVLVGCLVSVPQQIEPPRAAQDQQTILTVTDAIRSLSTTEFLFIQLKSGGQAEWENFDDGGKRQHNSSVLAAEELASIVRRLNSIDISNLPGKLGPYNTYTDTSAELKIQISTPKGDRTFSLINPWPCSLPSCSLGRKRQCP